MRDVHNVLNAILSKNIFEYILVDRELDIITTSDGVGKYLGAQPKEGENILDYLPELVGNEEEVKQIFAKKYCLYTLESVYKNEYYVDISIEYCDENSAIVLLHNTTTVAMAKQRLLQYSNESSLLYSALQKVVDSQNALIFVVEQNKIKFANQKFMDYFDVKDLEELEKKSLKLYKYYDENLINYDGLFDHVKDREGYIRINDDTFILKATLVESTHELFTLAKVTTLSNKTELDIPTGAYSKSYFNAVLNKMVHETGNCILAIMDLDDFKQINDKYGHQTGDKVLKELAVLIKSHIRKKDIFARWGGEEFVLLLEDSSIEDVLVKIETIRKAIEQYLFAGAIRLTSSVGIASLKEGESAKSLFGRADKALYEAKADGKNRVVQSQDLTL